MASHNNNSKNGSNNSNTNMPRKRCSPLTKGLWAIGFVVLAVGVHVLPLDAPHAYWSVSLAVYAMSLASLTAVRFGQGGGRRSEAGVTVVARSADPFYQTVSEGRDRRRVREAQIG